MNRSHVFVLHQTGKVKEQTAKTLTQAKYRIHIVFAARLTGGKYFVVNICKPYSSFKVGLCLPDTFKILL